MTLPNGERVQVGEWYDVVDPSYSVIVTSMASGYFGGEVWVKGGGSHLVLSCGWSGVGHNVSGYPNLELTRRRVSQLAPIPVAPPPSAPPPPAKSLAAGQRWTTKAFGSTVYVRLVARGDALSGVAFYPDDPDADTGANLAYNYNADGSYQSPVSGAWDLVAPYSGRLAYHDWGVLDPGSVADRAPCTHRGPVCNELIRGYCSCGLVEFELSRETGVWWPVGRLGAG